MAPYEYQVKNEYFEWLYDYVCRGRSIEFASYKELFSCLHNIEFTYIIRKDENRAKDGADLRYRFATNMGYEDLIYILDRPYGKYGCSVLEMIIALAIRCEETIMDDTRYGDRTGQWFWSMMSNLGISHMNDDKFDSEAVEEAIDIFLNREYDADGKGGLFHIRGCQYDLTNEEIWHQLCWYLERYT